MLCGDIECNPGPQKDQQSEALAELLKTVRDLNQRSIRMEEKVHARHCFGAKITKKVNVYRDI